MTPMIPPQNPVFMRRFLRFFVIVCLVGVGMALSAPAVLACRCAPPSAELMQKAYEDSRLVAKVRIESEIPDLENDRTKWDVSVLSRKKGMSKGRLTVYDRLDSCGNAFFDGQITMLAITKAKNGDYIAGDVCMQLYINEYYGFDPSGEDWADEEWSNDDLGR